MFDKINNGVVYNLYTRLTIVSLIKAKLSESVIASKTIVELKLITVNIHLFNFTCIQFLSFCAMTNMNFIKYTFIHKYNL